MNPLHNNLPPLIQDIILEGPFEKSFMYHAINEGFATAAEKLSPSEKESITTVLTDYRRSKKRTEVLELCLLYDKVLLYGYHDLFDMARLNDERLGISIDPTDAIFLSRWYPHLALDKVSTCRLLKPFALSYLKRRLPFLDSTSYDMLLELMTSDDIAEAVRAHKEEFATKVETVMWDSFRQRQTLDPGFVEFVKVMLEGEFFYRQKSAEIGRQLKFFPVFPAVQLLYDELSSLVDLMRLSVEMSTAIATPKLKAYTASKPIPVPQYETSDTYYRVFQVVLREIEYFPVVNSLSDVLKLRNDKRILDFRVNLARWAEAIQKHDESEEEKLRREIRKSNEVLQSIKPWKKAGTFLTYIALPLSFIPFLGLPLTMMSIAIQLYTDYTEWRNRWLMIGR